MLKLEPGGPWGMLLSQVSSLVVRSLQNVWGQLKAVQALLPWAAVFLVFAKRVVSNLPFLLVLATIFAFSMDGWLREETKALQMRLLW